MFELLDALSSNVFDLILTTSEAVAAAAPAAADAAVNAVGDAAAQAAAAAAPVVQDAATAVAAAPEAVVETAKEAAKKPTFIDDVKLFFEEGGHFMYVNVCSLTIALSVVVERTIRLYMSYSMNSRLFMDQISRLVAEDQVERAIKITSGGDPTKPIKAPMASVVRAGLRKADEGESEISGALEEAVMEATPLIQTRVAALWSISNIAVLVGLVGTILGLISAFKSLGAVSADKRSEVLSAGISEAMNNTAFGLGIAVTCIIAHLILSSKAKSMIEEIELCSLRVEKMLSKRLDKKRSQAIQKAS
ncbi:MAG: MotA/TolQ/ExbB proton channel family protein [Myxococcales bacterium]|jgi:biopolymer transport protein ExbB/TolQ|nr:MotA/TolQ/ExbB proton channel family protein [Myxococcales bacterium]